MKHTEPNTLLTVTGLPCENAISVGTLSLAPRKYTDSEIEAFGKDAEGYRFRLTFSSSYQWQYSPCPEDERIESDLAVIPSAFVIGDGKLYGFLCDYRSPLMGNTHVTAVFSLDGSVHGNARDDECLCLCNTEPKEYDTFYTLEAALIAPKESL